MLQEFATAWLKGAAVSFLITITAIQVIGGIAILAKWESFSLGLRPLRIFEYTGRTGNTIFELTYRGELVLVALLAGLLYGLAAMFMLP